MTSKSRNTTTKAAKLARVAGTRGITGETALRLARYFGTTPGYWIGMQAQYDLEMAA
jgi:antitoxin HigA-1